MANIDDIEKEERAERRMRYQFLAQQIDTIKGHHWAMTYYALLVFAGIVGITKLVSNSFNQKVHICIGIFLILISAFTCIFIIFLLSKYQRCLMANRNNSITIENTFYTEEEFRSSTSTIPEKYFQFWYQGYILGSLIVSIVLGFIFSIAYIIVILF